MSSSLSLRDLFFLLGQKRKLLVTSTFVGAALLFGMVLTKPILYKAEGTFVDRGKSNGIEPSALTLSLLEEKGGEVLSLLQSDRILEKTIVKLGLQAQISPAPGIPFFLRPLYQLRSAWAHFKNEKTPVFSDTPPPFLLTNLSYEGEELFSFELFLFEDGTYKTDAPIPFTLEKTTHAKEGLYQVTLIPKKSAIKDLKGTLLIEPSKKINELVLLDCITPSRMMSALILNTLMLEAEIEMEMIERSGASKQVAVLEERQAKSLDKLEQLLQTHADTLSRDLAQIGFIDTDKALAFYAQAEDQIEKDLLKLEFEKRRIEEALKVGLEKVERLSSLKGLATLDLPFHELRDLKAKREALSFALFHDDSTFPLIHKQGLRWTHNPLQPFQSDFSPFVQQPFLESNSTYEGLSSDVSFNLLLAYQKGIDEVDDKRKQLSHLLEQLDIADVPLSAIAMSFEGNEELGQNIKALELALQDPKNRSQKEQERVRDELALERSFMKSHFQGLQELLSLRRELLEKKIVELRHVALQGVQQELSLLENEILMGLSDRLVRIEEERDLLEEEKLKLQTKLAPLPDRWVSETLLQQKLHLHQNLFGELTRLSENKEIASKLNLVLSSPLDRARVPLLPIDPRLLLFSLLGGFSGFFFSLSFLLFDITRKGLPATPTSLKGRGQKALQLPPIQRAVSLETLPDKDLDALRKLLLQTKDRSLFLGFPSHIFPLMASLYYRKTGTKPYIVDLDGAVHPEKMIVEHPEYNEYVITKDRFLLETIGTADFQKKLSDLNAPFLLCYSSRKDPFTIPTFDITFIVPDQETVESLEAHFDENSCFVFTT